jgi:uncharacterized protein involved in exopolysaccharide biosynthesis
MEEEIDLRPYIGALLHYWWVIVVAGLIAAILAYVFVATRPPVYQASALVTVLEPNQLLQFDPRISTVTTRNTLTRVLPELAKSDQLLESLASTLSENDITTDENLENKLTAQAGREPILLYLQVNHEDAEKSAQIANTWAELFVAKANEVYANQGDSRLRFYERQFEASETRLAEANEALAAFQGENRLALVTNELNSLTLTHASVISHTNALKTLQDDIQAARLQQEELSPGTILSTDQFTALILQARALNVEETFPLMFQIQPATATGSDGPSAVEYLESLEQMVTAMEINTANRLADMESQLLTLQQEFEQLTAQTTRLTVDRDLALETYSSLSRKLDEERIAAQDMSSGFRIASRASIPSSTSKTNSIYAALLGAAFGVILSSLVIILITWWRK